jgi:uncharacterized coiled-coil protein SlyX
MDSAYKDMSDQEKVTYLEARLAEVNRANQSVTDTLYEAARSLALIVVKLDHVVEKTRRKGD